MKCASHSSSKEIQDSALQNTDIIIRPATLEDSSAILSIYAPYVEQTAISFEYSVPSLSEFQARMRNTLEQQRLPYLVAEYKGQIKGYAYVSPFKERAAYDWAVETSIYVASDMRGMGLGGRLHAVLEDCCRALGITNLNACIGHTEHEDKHLTNASEQFHAHLGYRMVGCFYQCGYKFDRWYDMVWMEKIIADHPAHPQPRLSFDELQGELFTQTALVE